MTFSVMLVLLNYDADENDAVNTGLKTNPCPAPSIVVLLCLDQSKMAEV